LNRAGWLTAGQIWLHPERLRAPKTRRGAVQQQKQQQQQQVEEVHQGSWQLAWGERERGEVVTDSC